MAPKVNPDPDSEKSFRIHNTRRFSIFKVPRRGSPPLAPKAYGRICTAPVPTGINYNLTVPYFLKFIFINVSYPNLWDPLFFRTPESVGICTDPNPCRTLEGAERTEINAFTIKLIHFSYKREGPDSVVQIRGSGSV